MDPTQLLDPTWLTRQLGVNVVLVALLIVVARSLVGLIPGGSARTKLLRRLVIAALCAVPATIQYGTGVRPAVLGENPSGAAVWLTLWLGTFAAAPPGSRANSASTWCSSPC